MGAIFLIQLLSNGSQRWFLKIKGEACIKESCHRKGNYMKLSPSLQSNETASICIYCTNSCVKSHLIFHSLFDRQLTRTKLAVVWNIQRRQSQQRRIQIFVSERQVLDLVELLKYQAKTKPSTFENLQKMLEIESTGGD